MINIDWDLILSLIKISKIWYYWLILFLSTIVMSAQKKHIVVEEVEKMIILFLNCSDWFRQKTIHNFKSEIILTAAALLCAILHSSPVGGRNEPFTCTEVPEEADKDFYHLLNLNGLQEMNGSRHNFTVKISEISGNFFTSSQRQIIFLKKNPVCVPQKNQSHIHLGQYEGE